jgi:hypothetical protein
MESAASILAADDEDEIDLTETRVRKELLTDIVPRVPTSFFFNYPPKKQQTPLYETFTTFRILP